MGRLDTLVRREGLSDPVTETRTYDLASRLTTRVVKTAAGAVLDGDTLGYNLVGKVVHTNLHDSVSYHPLGYVTQSTFAGKTESFTLDAMANRVTAPECGDLTVQEVQEFGCGCTGTTSPRAHGA